MNIIRLKEVLKKKGVTGKELAEKVGVTAGSISNISNGSIPRSETLVKIAQALDVDIRELFVSTKKNKTDNEKLKDAVRNIQEVISSNE
ncbi:hypothetical protein GCM10011344_32660 [Dokdonia pacifica]|uniref:DNA-binding transcriptional regulator, XRE family n=1 Tax=Dokdonia pacifica TaxID=1627892 RepID=A0A239BHP1_9FLAO|nr:helix-turn-helix transcriptional regulator [Dokdonia pacifica]GGG29280.1 hypothetical protein GCM10011344_32660 [Dokdonia pacifica]SNS07625.1 DNA-binding transcriptional regulator, XRE family [Dokdonia pacifica]